MPAPYTDIRSSLPLQVALYFNSFYSAAFFVVTLLLFIYKGAKACACLASIRIIFVLVAQQSFPVAGIMLPYPAAAIGLEVAFVFAWAIVESARIYLGAGHSVRCHLPVLGLSRLHLQGRGETKQSSLGRFLPPSPWPSR